MQFFYELFSLIFLTFQKRRKSRRGNCLVLPHASYGPGFKLIFFCWRSNFKNSCFVFHRGFKHSKTIKALGLRPRAFISFLVFETPMKHSHSFLKYYVNIKLNLTWQQQYVLNKNTLIVDHLFGSFSTTFKNVVFICSC